MDGAAPLMANTASTLPTRSTTAIVAGWLRATPSCTAWLTMRSTSDAVRWAALGAHGPLQPVTGFDEPPPPQPGTSADTSASHNSTTVERFTDWSWMLM